MLITVLLAAVTAQACKIWTPQRQGKFPLISFTPDQSTPITLYDGFLKDLSHSGFIIMAASCPDYNETNQIDWT